MPAQPLSRRALWTGAVCALTVLAIWTSFILVARSSARHTLTPFDIAFLRFVFSGAVALPIALWRWPALRRGLGGAAALWRGTALTLVAGVAYSALAYSAFFIAPAAHGAVLLPGSLPLWTTVFAVLLLGDRLTRPRVLGLALIVAGDLLVGGSSLLSALNGGSVWRGDLLFLCASACWALYGVLCRRWQVGAVDATLAIAVGCLVSYVPVFALGAASGFFSSQLAAAPWREIIFQAVFQGGFSMLVAGWAFTQVVTTFGPVRTTMITALVPGLAALAAVPLLGEALGPAALGGLVCVTCGLLLGLRHGGPAPALKARAA
jgi:drug/metabolite transporter (DMT)-like permease